MLPAPGSAQPLRVGEQHPLHRLALLADGIVRALARHALDIAAPVDGEDRADAERRDDAEREENRNEVGAHHATARRFGVPLVAGRAKRRAA